MKERSNVPSVSDELRELMKQRFGSIDDGGPVKFLKDAGYELTDGHQWKPKPGISRIEKMTQEEFEAMLFLIDEWDYGGLLENE